MITTPPPPKRNKKCSHANHIDHPVSLATEDRELTAPQSKERTERGLGGWGISKVSQIRREEKNVLLLDAGDQFQGTVWFNYYKGAEAAHFMNKLGYNVMVIVF